MFDMYPSPDDAALMAAIIADLVRRIEPIPCLYLAAAAAAAFWHRGLWLVYLGLAVAALLVGHR